MTEAFDWLVNAEHDVRSKLVDKFSQRAKNDFEYLWDYATQPEQLAPPDDWRIWIIIAGRGFGKTRAEGRMGANDRGCQSQCPYRAGASLAGRGMGGDGREGERHACDLLARSSPALRALTAPHPVAQRRARPVVLGGRTGRPARPAAQPCLHGQAQKEFYVNQSLAILDALAPRAVVASHSQPPADSVENACYPVTGPAPGD